MAINNQDDLSRRFRQTSSYSPHIRPSMQDVRRARQPLASRATSAAPSAPIRTPLSTARPGAAPSALNLSDPLASPRQQANTAAPTQPVNPSLKPARAAKPRRRRLRRLIMLVVLLAIIGGIAWFGMRAFANVQKVFKGNVFNLFTTTKLNGEDTGRVNILLAGNSADDPGHDGAQLTDSIMLVSIDVQHDTAALISIPRDLWVNIPGFGHAKINEAYVDGQNENFSAAGYWPGGMGLLQEVVAQNLGIKANYYALVNYNGLRDAVNAVGGVDFDVQSSDPRGLYDPSIDYATHQPLVRLTNGWHHLDGEQALDLARARGDTYGAYGFPAADFNRTANQRQLILALKQKVFSVSTLANPFTISQLFTSLGANVKTDFTLSEVRRLYDIGKNITSSNVQSVGLNNASGTNLLANYHAPNGESALTPAAGYDDFSAIDQYLSRLLTDNPLVREGAQIVVLNGSNTAGLAAAAQQELISAHNLTVSAVGDAPVTGTTTIINATGPDAPKPATLALLKNLYHATVTTTNPYAGTYNADFIVVLGTDWAASHTPSASTQ